MIYFITVNWQCYIVCALLIFNVMYSNCVYVNRRKAKM